MLVPERHEEEMLRSPLKSPLLIMLRLPEWQYAVAPNIMSATPHTGQADACDAMPKVIGTSHGPQRLRLDMQASPLEVHQPI